MSGQQANELNEQRRSHMDAAAWAVPFFYIWGAQWCVSALLDFFFHLDSLSWERQATAATALAASIVLLLKLQLSGNSQGRLDFKPLLPALLILASIVLLYYIQAIDPYFLPVARSLFLCFMLVQVGLYIGRALVFLGLWLFALTCVISIWYLGYTPMILSFFGGISLIAAGWTIRRLSLILREP